MEFTCFVFSGWCLVDAWRRGRRWVVTLLAAVLFGLAAELFFLVTEAGSPRSHYTYGDFLVMLGWGPYLVPLWVATGWGTIVYASLWTVERLHLPILARTAVASLLAVNIDLSLDPVAELLGFWHWHNVPSGNYCGVPFDNFLGWLMIVGTYVFSWLALFARVPTRWAHRDYWLPLAALVPALLATAVGQLLLNAIYSWSGQQTVPFLVIASGVIAVAGYHGRSSRRDHATNRFVLTLPVFFHLMLLGILLYTGLYAEQAFLVVLIPLNLLIGFSAHAWWSLERLCPTPSGMAASAE